MSVKKEDVDNAVVNFCLDVIKEPLLHFSEADLQQILVEKLRNIDSLNVTNVSRNIEGDSFYKTNLIHREYGSTESERIDVIIFDDNDIKKINTLNLTYKLSKGKQKYLLPKFGFELGTEKCKLEKTKKHIQSDILKLGKCKEAGYIIHIFRDIAVTRKGTKKRIKTEDRIKKNFKRIVEEESKAVSKKIKIIAIRINPYRQKERNWTRLEIFQRNKTDLWKKYENIGFRETKEIKQIILSQLN